MFGTLFGPPNIEKMQKKGDVDGLIKAMQYKKSSKEWPCWAPKALGILSRTEKVPMRVLFPMPVEAMK